LSVIQEEQQQQDPITMFLYALRLQKQEESGHCRLKIFLDFLKLDGTTKEEKAKQFMIKARQSPQWAQDIFMEFIAFQIERVRRNEISETTFQIL
jgi:hypothetical protein